jgi:hypothetical protein
MSEDTPVNTGVGSPDPDGADLLVRMQVKLHHWAAADAAAGFMICSTWSATRRF